MQKTQVRRMSATAVQKSGTSEDGASIRPTRLQRKIAAIERDLQSLDTEQSQLDPSNKFHAIGCHQISEERAKLSIRLRVARNLVSRPVIPKAGVFKGWIWATKDQTDHEPIDLHDRPSNLPAYSPDIKTTAQGFKRDVGLYLDSAAYSRFQDTFGCKVDKAWWLEKLRLDEWTRLVNLRAWFALDTDRPGTVEDWKFCVATDELTERLDEVTFARQCGKGDYCGLRERVMELYRRGYMLYVER